MLEMMMPLRQWFTPQRVTLLGSLILSLVAYMGAVTITKDGALYADIARTITDDGLSAGAARFNWVGFSLLLSVVHQLTGLSIEAVAYLSGALFVAGACALLVDIIARYKLKAAWWGVLVVLSIPAFNTFRGDVIREHGFWFFSVLALWLALDWQVRGGFWRGQLVHAAIAMAIFFRLEALVLEAALVLWLAPGLRSREGARKFIGFFGGPLLLGIALLLLVLASDLLLRKRLDHYLGMLNPMQIQQDFQALSQQFADSLKRKYSRDDAGVIILFGLIGLILISFIKLLGPFAVTLFTRAGRQQGVAALPNFRLFALTFGIYALVLLLFFFHMQFINSRYLSFLNLLAVPLVAVMTYGFAVRHPKWSRVLFVLATLMMLDNVISLSAKKTHFIEAGEWLAEHHTSEGVLFFGDGRIRYYAGWGYLNTPQPAKLLKLESTKINSAKIIVIEAEPDEKWLIDWLEREGLVQIAAFSNRKGESVQIVGHKSQLQWMDEQEP